MQKKIPWLIICLICIIALIARIVPGPRSVDDSFITFRYAQNILAGEGFVYNPGERVLGTTTPLYTLLMVGLGSLSGGQKAPFPLLALSANAIFDAVTCVMLYYLGKQLKHEFVGLATALIWAVAPYSVTFAIGGMETSLYICLLTGSFLFYLRKNRTVTAFLGGLAITTRPDAVLLIGPMVLDYGIRLIKQKQFPRADELAAFFIPTLGWTIFSLCYFGSPFPHSVSAKLLVYQLGPNAALIRFIQHYATPFLSSPFLPTAISITIGLFLFPTLFIIGARQAYKINAATISFALYPWIYFLAFTIPNPLIFRWYLTPPLPAYILMILLGITQIIQAIFKTESTKKLSLILIVTFIFILPIGNNLLNWSIQPDHGFNRPAPEMAWYKLELLYQQAAETVKPFINNHTVIAAGDVGALGYYTQAKILDTVGLNSEQSLNYYPIPKESYVTNYAIPTELILTELPDWLIIQEVYGRNTLLNDPDFKEQYRLFKLLDNNIYGSEGMVIYQRAGN
jgi:hypothetical protein